MHFFHLSTIDPRSKIIMMGSLSAAVMLTQKLTVQLALLCLTVLTLLLGGIRSKRMWLQLRGILAVLLFLFLLQSIFVRSGAPLLAVDQIVLVRAGGVHFAAVLCLRFLTILLAALILLTGDFRDYLLAMVQCRVPYDLAFMVMTGVHFLPVLREEAIHVYDAAQLRGTEIAGAKLRVKLQAYRQICLPILTGALRKSKSAAMAMELRGLRAYPERTYRRRLVMKRRDFFFLLLYLCIGAICVIL